MTKYKSLNVTTEVTSGKLCALCTTWLWTWLHKLVLSWTKIKIWLFLWRIRLGYTGLFISPSGIFELDCATTKTDTVKRSISIGRESLQVFFCTRSLGLLPGSTRPMGPDGLFFSQRTGSHQLEFMYHSRIVSSGDGSVWYMIRNLRCTVTIDSVLANSKTQIAFWFTVNATFLHDNT